MPGKPRRSWFLTISTFKNVDPDATHYYGRIRTPHLNGAVDVLSGCVIDVEQKRLGTTIGNTVRFQKEEEVVKAAKEWFKKNGKSGEMLILGRMGNSRDVILARKR
jgi:hypothetical protein